jgi:transcriptional regulator with XRE-family HTH domain
MHHKLHLVLRDLLKKHGQSARKAAKACGVPLSTFNGYLKPDRHQIDPNHLLAMARYFDVSLDYLVSGRDQGRRIDGLPTKRLFSRWVKLTIEEIADEDDLDFLKGGKK